MTEQIHFRDNSSVSIYFIDGKYFASVYFMDVDKTLGPALSEAAIKTMVLSYLFEGRRLVDNGTDIGKAISDLQGIRPRFT